MADNRKYYYLKLKDSYFDDDSIVLLESMQDGILYSYILLKLYLKSLKNAGKLQLDEHIPYTAQMIATITRHQVGIVERALQIYLQLGLMEVLDDGTYYMSNIELFIGQSSPPLRGSETEVQDLQGEFPAEYEKCLERLSQYIASSGKKYQSHAATIRYWITTDREKIAKKQGSIPDYSYKEGESL